MHAAELAPRETSIVREGTIVPQGRLRRGLATAAVMAGAGAMLEPVSMVLNGPEGGVFLAAAAVAAVLLHFNHLGAQLAVRSVLWGSMAVAGVLGVSGYFSGHANFWAAPVASAAALAVVGGMGMGAQVRTGAFAPKAFRRTLMATVVSAGAASLIGLFFLVALPPHAGMMLAAGAYAAVQAFGGLSLYRMRAAGLGLLFATNVAVAASLFGGLDGAVIFAPMALIQTLLMLPVFGRVLLNLLRR